MGLLSGKVYCPESQGHITRGGRIAPDITRYFDTSGLAKLSDPYELDYEGSPRWNPT